MRTTACAVCCLLLLCCAEVLGQIVDGGVQQDATAAEVSSSVSASVSSDINFKVGHAARGSGSSAGAATATSNAVVESLSSVDTNPAIDFDRGRGAAAVASRMAAIPSSASRKDVASRRQKLTASRSSQLRTLLDRNEGYSRAPVTAQQSALSTRTPSAANGSQQPSAGSADFPDSTRGTGTVSPADLGTLGPLAGTPGFAPGLKGFGTDDFLNPSFHVGERATGMRVGDRSTGMRGSRSEALRARRNRLSQKQPSLLFGSPDQELEPNTLTQPSASDPLSIDRQLGLQNGLGSGSLDHQ
jgi:hypothetical protein